MSKELKIVSVGAVLCVAGAICLDCHVSFTGWTLIGIGGFAIIMGPLLMEF